MSVERVRGPDPRMQAAIGELKKLIRSRYPSVSFDVSPSIDEPEIVHLTATVDVDDTEEVVDLVIDRMLDLQITEGLPLYVIPVRTPARVAALRAAASRASR